MFRNPEEAIGIKKYLIITLGTLSTAAGISLFYLPNKIVNGGVSGLATIVFHTLHISPGITYAIVNLLLFAACGFALGKKFLISSLWGTVSLTLFVEAFSYLPAFTQNPLLAASFGGILYGGGIGLVLTQGASTGGTDILARLLQLKLPHISINGLLLFVDGAIIVLSLLIFRNTDTSLLGVLSLVVSTGTIRMLMKYLNVSKLAFVVTDKGDEMAKLLITTSPRGCTQLHARGSYTDSEKDMLVCALKPREAPEFMSKVKQVDPQAFTIFSESQQIYGNGFFVYR